MLDEVAVKKMLKAFKQRREANTMAIADDSRPQGRARLIDADTTAIQVLALVLEIE